MLQIYLKILVRLSKKRAAEFMSTAFMTPMVSKDFVIKRYKELDLFTQGTKEYVKFQNYDIFTYRVRKVEKVPWKSRANSSTLKHIARLSPTQDETLTLVTCGGANFAPFPSRIYVTAKRLSGEP